MPRVYAFVYACGDGRSPGEVKIGNTSAVSHEAAISKVTSRYKMVYGRCLQVFKVIPVALPKMQAEDMVKDLLAPYHSCGELYDLPTADTAETQHFLDLAYADLEVPFADAHFVDKPSPADRKMELERQRLEIVEREADRISRKRARVEEQAAEDERIYQARLQKTEQKAEKRLKQVDERSSQSDVEQWVQSHVGRQDGQHFTLVDAYRHFKSNDGNVAQRVFKHKLEKSLESQYHAFKKINGRAVRNVFWNVRILGHHT